MYPRRTFNILDFLRYIYYSYLPNRDNNLKQVLIKLIFIISILSFLVSGIYISGYFINSEREENLIMADRKIWDGTTVIKSDENDFYEEDLTPEIALIRKNTDFKGWITIGDTKINNPIYQTDDNKYYLTHNSERKNSSYGALFFDYRNEITREKTDKHLVVYGNDIKNGSLFGELKKLRSLDFYKQHPTFEFATYYTKNTYKIYSIFVLNADRADDDGNIYNILGQDFVTDEGFESWVNDAKERSLININVDVNLGDETLALVTSCDDFTNARLVVMARKTRENEDVTVNTQSALLNANPKYPKRWYTERNISN